MADMSEIAALRQLQTDWAEMLDEGFREEHERQLDLGWHVGLVYPEHANQVPLVALKYLNWAVLWIDYAKLFKALERVTGDYFRTDEDSWFDLGNNRFILEVCQCGSSDCGCSMAEIHVVEGDLYIGLLADGRGGPLHLTPDHYGLPLPIRLPLKTFYRQFAGVVEQLNKQELGVPLWGWYREDAPSPHSDGWLTPLLADGKTWRSLTHLRWEREEREWASSSDASRPRW